MMEKISNETKVRIEEGLKNWGDPNNPAYQRFLEARGKWNQILKPLSDAIEAVERQ